jgi:hypothetical protein
MCLRSSAPAGHSTAPRAPSAAASLSARAHGRAAESPRIGVAPAARLPRPRLGRCAILLLLVVVARRRPHAEGQDGQHGDEQADAPDDADQIGGAVQRHSSFVLFVCFLLVWRLGKADMTLPYCGLAWARRMIGAFSLDTPTATLQMTGGKSRACPRCEKQQRRQHTTKSPFRQVTRLHEKTKMRMSGR